MKNQKLKRFFIELLLALTAIYCLTGAMQLTDPTRPPDATTSDSRSVEATGPLQVSAVFVYPDRRLALINNQYATVGDQVGSYTVINIQRDTVELKDSHDARVTLNVVPDIKTTVTVK